MKPERETKSIWHETTFEWDIDAAEVLRAWLLDLTEQVGWLAVASSPVAWPDSESESPFADFSTITRSQTLPEPTNVTQELWKAADKMFCHRWGAQPAHRRVTPALTQAPSARDAHADPPPPSKKRPNPKGDLGFSENRRVPARLGTPHSWRGQYSLKACLLPSPDYSKPLSCNVFRRCNI